MHAIISIHIKVIPVFLPLFSSHCLSVAEYQSLFSVASDSLSAFSLTLLDFAP